MGFKIDKGWINTIGVTGVKRKESADAIQTLEDRNSKDNQQHQQKNENQDNQREYQQEELEKAVLQMRDSVSFKQSGLQIELVVSPEGFQIKLSHATGELIKFLSAEEFMKLKELSSVDTMSRGKILDQKY